MPENFLSEYGAKFFVSFLALGSFLLFFMLHSRDRANSHPRAVINLLNKLGPDYKVVTNVVISDGRGIFDVGIVVISPYGVFVINVKQEVGKIIGKKSDREWEVKLGGSRDYIPNPIWENGKHINALEKVFGSGPFISVVVFSRGKLKGDFGNNVIRLAELAKFVSQNKTFRVSVDKQNEILKAMLKR